MHSETTSPGKLSAQDFARISNVGIRKTFKKDEVIFSDGDSADYIYFIESGHIYIFIDNFTSREEISTMAEGEYFGEMAFFAGDRRSASAAALLDSTLLLLDRNAFLSLLESDQALAAKINGNFAQRNRELAGKEAMGGWESGGREVKIGIKGDPSLRETAFSRERYDSVVDKILTELQPRLYDLLLNRCAYEVFIHCNSGEVRVRGVLDPFSDDIHQAHKLLNVAYLDRHFPVMDYREKIGLIKRMYGFMAAQSSFDRASDTLGNGLRTSLGDWQPVSEQKLARTLARLVHLRMIPNFYLRNFSISIIRDSIRMQFNCDGTQIVSSKGFQQFLEDNLLEDELGIQNEVERRLKQRRMLHHQAMFRLGERRSPPGRRQDDWITLTGGDTGD